MPNKQETLWAWKSKDRVQQRQNNAKNTDMSVQVNKTQELRKSCYQLQRKESQEN